MFLSNPIVSGQNAQWTITIARLAMGGCFMFYGISKLWFIPGTTNFVGTKLPMPELVFWLAVVLETGLGFLIVIGYATRWAAAYFVFHCLFTAVVFHTNFALRPQMDHFFANIVLAAGFLLLLAVGPGAAALDNARNKTT
jgi:putative oxidoreductase